MATKTSLNSGPINFAARMKAIASNYMYHTSEYNEVVANLRGGGYVPISYLARIGFYNERNRYPVNSELAPYLQNGHIFDDSHRNDSQLVGGDTAYGDKTVYTFSLPADIQRPMIGGLNSGSIVKDASGNLIVKDAFLPATKTTATTVQQAANMYASTLPTNSIATASTVSNTGFYVLLSVIGVAIVWKKSKRF